MQSWTQKGLITIIFYCCFQLSFIIFSILRPPRRGRHECLISQLSDPCGYRQETVFYSKRVLEKSGVAECYINLHFFNHCFMNHDVWLRYIYATRLTLCIEPLISLLRKPFAFWGKIHFIITIHNTLSRLLMIWFIFCIKTIKIVKRKWYRNNNLFFINIIIYNINKW